eukprot:CCRYP_021006-RA/>CCRYP_021006-RA protein AED:0.23 eAED:0.23 QI:80/1/1/1/1/1/3/1097/156
MQTSPAKRIVVVGTGDKAHGMANMYECYANKEHFTMVFTEPLQSKKMTAFNDSVSVEPFPKAIEACDICILAIPDYAMEMFLIQNFSLMNDSIMIDLTNGNGSNKRDLKVSSPLSTLSSIAGSKHSMILVQSKSCNIIPVANLDSPRRFVGRTKTA